MESKHHECPGDLSSRIDDADRHALEVLELRVAEAAANLRTATAQLQLAQEAVQHHTLRQCVLAEAHERLKQQLVQRYADVRHRFQLEPTDDVQRDGTIVRGPQQERPLTAV